MLVLLEMDCIDCEYVLFGDGGIDDMVISGMNEYLGCMEFDLNKTMLFIYFSQIPFHRSF